MIMQSGISPRCDPTAIRIARRKTRLGLAPVLPVEHWRLFGLSCSEFLFSVQPVWRCGAFHVRRGRGPKLAIHSVGGLSRREILKISAALAGSGVFLSTDSAAAQPGG